MEALRRRLVGQWEWVLGRASWFSGGVVGLLSLWALLGDGVWIRGSYDFSHRLPGNGMAVPDASPVLIVYLDTVSHQREGQDPAGLWDRRIHARLIRRLAASGAKGVVFDVLFMGAGPDPAADREFEESLRSGIPVLLAGETLRTSTMGADGVSTRARHVQKPHDPFLRAAAGWGLAEAKVDADFVAREMFDGFPLSDEPSLALAAARLLSGATVASPRRWIRYYGAPLALPHLSYSQALRPEEAPDDLFRNRLVLVGARPDAGAFAERRDEFRNPVRSWRDSDRFMPGVEVHATEILNRVRGDGLRRWPLPMEAVALLASAGGLAGWFFRLRPAKAGLVCGAVVFGVVLVASLGYRFGFWFPWLVILVVQVPLLFAVSVVVHSVEWYREKRRMEARMQQLRRLEAMGSLAGGLVHDLNNALGPVLMGLGLLRQRSSDSETQRMLQVMESSVHRGVGMVRQVLLFARGNDQERAILSVGGLLEELEAFLRGSFPETIQVSVLKSAQLWSAAANSSQLYQVLLNLCVNARDAMPSGGSLLIAAENGEISEDEAATFQPRMAPGFYVLLTVCDSGHGMEPEVQARLFEPFYTTKGAGRGTGLGLSTSLRLLEWNRGGLRFRSDPGEGTTFEIAVPAAFPKENAPLPATRTLEGGGHGESIALIEPEEAFRKILADVLAAHGYRVQVMNPLGMPTTRVDLIVLGADAIDVSTQAWLSEVQLRSNLAVLPVVLTGKDAAQTAATAPVRSMLAALPRPFAIESFLERIRRVLDHARASQG